MQSLMLWWPPTRTLFLLLIHDCNFATIMNLNVNIFGDRCLSKGPQAICWEPLKYNIKHTKAKQTSEAAKILRTESEFAKENRSPKVAICKRRMSLNFRKFCPSTYVTTKCYTGPMVRVCSETTRVTTKCRRWVSIPGSSGPHSKGLKEGIEGRWGHL